SYCFSLLKRFPLAAGINPNAEVDDKNIHGDDFFEQGWPAWLRTELAARSPRRAEWLEVLEKVALEKIRDLARRLCDFDVPLESLPLAEKDQTLSLLTKLLKPFIAKFREGLLAEGYLSNNAL